ncbi:low molecular weight protein-tyrosine-phosphatase [Halomonas sp. HP20-15]|uniref:low molecular weight protein-tyrosine-phosphatase n=1 Tax=Halomonas sp. HP20-15 TaxID=3085901 RepID=UPI002981028F|nr:low molecular weight protein-tyrosine-phosphatase [Halomonas sp. HP20-15]MDW5377036.1 low molecular weight protein-tyrosine-phosphatase [Halomonas sp. HP20-15]
MIQFSRLLVVCTGNTCRSPVAAALLRARLPALTIESAGLGALVGHGVEPTSRELAEREGLNVESHRARQVTQEMIQWADLVLVMSESQRLAIGKLDPASIGKTFLLGRWSGTSDKGQEIPDPYRKSHEVFEYVHGQLVRAADAWQKKLG